MLLRTSPSFDVCSRVRSSRRTTVTGRSPSDSSMKWPTLLPSAAATFIRLVIVGVIPDFSILWIEAGERPERLASCWGDQPRSARVFATLAPIPETVCSISEPKYGGVVDIDFPTGNVHHPKRRRQAISFPMVNISCGPRASDLRHPLGYAEVFA